MAKHAVDPAGSGVQHGGSLKRTPASGTAALELDSVIHERVRLGIISALAVNDELSFNDLKKLLEITDGNLSVHARKLEVAGYVKCSKSFVGRQPRTEFSLTANGRRALEEYLKQMESVIRVGAEELGSNGAVRPFCLRVCFASESTFGGVDNVHQRQLRIAPGRAVLPRDLGLTVLLAVATVVLFFTRRPGRAIPCWR